MERQFLRLVRKNLLSYPEVGEVIKDHVPLGKQYEILGFVSQNSFYNEIIDGIITVDCYIVKADGKVGLLPVEVFGD